MPLKWPKRRNYLPHPMDFAMSRLLVLLLIGFCIGCRSPLTDLHFPGNQGRALAVPSVLVEDHSRSLKHIRDIAPGEVNSAETRKSALEDHRKYLDASFRMRAPQEGIQLDSASPYRLDLTLTSVGEVRTKYIVYGILSGVAWGVGTGLITHNAKLAVGLGAYELVEESIFWIAGSSLFGRYSAPVVLEAQIFEQGKPKAIWSETYYVISGGKRLKSFPENAQRARSIQLHASLEHSLDKLFDDLKSIPKADLH